MHESVRIRIQKYNLYRIFTYLRMHFCIRLRIWTAYKWILLIIFLILISDHRYFAGTCISIDSRISTMHAVLTANREINELSNYAPLDLVVTITRKHGKVRSMARRTECTVMPCFCANRPLWSHSVVFGMLVLERPWVRVPASLGSQLFLFFF